MSSRIDHFLESLWNNLRVTVLSVLTRFSCQSGNLNPLVFRQISECKFPNGPSLKTIVDHFSRLPSDVDPQEFLGGR